MTISAPTPTRDLVRYRTVDLVTIATLAVALGLAACAPAPTVPTAPDTSNIVPGIYGARTDTGPNGEPIEIAAVKPAGPDPMMMT